MNKLEELKIKFETQISIYRDSPGTTVTFVDLARVYEDLLSLIEIKNEIGFTNNKEIK